MGTYYPAPTKATPVDTTTADIQPVPSGGPASGGGTVNPGAASAVDHTHAGPVIPPQGSQTIGKIVGGFSGGFTGLKIADGGWGVASGLVTVGNKVVAPGVLDSTNSWINGVLVYDLATDAWTVQTIQGWVTGTSGVGVNYSTVIMGNAAANQTGTNSARSCDADGQGRIWTAHTGGNQGARPTQRHFGFFDTNAWTYTDLSAGLPAGFATSATGYVAGMGVVGGIVYVFLRDNTFWSYTPSTKTWAQLTSPGAIGTPQAGPAAGAGVFVVVDGTTATHIYTPGVGWSNLNHPAAWSFLAGNGGCGRYFVITYTKNGTTEFAQVLDVVGNVWSAELPLAAVNQQPAGGLAPVGPSLLLLGNSGLNPNPAVYRIDPGGNSYSSGKTIILDTTAVVTAGKVVAGGPAPTVAAGAALGTAPPAPTVTAGSTDRAGAIGMGTGTAPAVGNAAVVTFSSAYPAAPKSVQLTPLNAATAALQPYVAATAAGSFTIGFGVAPGVSQAAGTYQLAFSVTG